MYHVGRLPLHTNYLDVRAATRRKEAGKECCADD